MIGALNVVAMTTAILRQKQQEQEEASKMESVKEFMRANMATGQALEQLYTKASKRHDCEGCGAPVQRLAHHCEYCGRQT